MKTILLIGLLTAALFGISQEKIIVIMGSKKFEFNGIQIYASENEKTYYAIEDGTLHYYYVNNWQGKCIDFVHHSCPSKSIDTKDVSYSEYNSAWFLNLKTKKMADDVTTEKYTDKELTGPSEDKHIENTVEKTSYLTLLIQTKEKGSALIEALK